MRRVRLFVETNLVGIQWDEVVEFEDDELEEMSDRDLDQIAEEFMWENVSYGWTVLD